MFRHTGYAARIDLIAAYFQHQLELLHPPVWQEFVLPLWNCLYQGQGRSTSQVQRTGRGQKFVDRQWLYRRRHGRKLHPVPFGGDRKDAVVRNSIISQNVRIGLRWAQPRAVRQGFYQPPGAA